MEQLLEETTGQGSYLDERIKATLGELYSPVMLIKNINSTDRIQARMPYWINLNI